MLFLLQYLKIFYKVFGKAFLHEREVTRAGRLLQIGVLVGFANILADVVSPFVIDILPPGLEPNRGAILAAVTLGGMLPMGVVVGGGGEDGGDGGQIVAAPPPPPTPAGEREDGHTGEVTADVVVAVNVPDGRL